MSSSPIPRSSQRTDPVSYLLLRLSLHRLYLLCFFVALLLTVEFSPAQKLHPTESQVKAAYLYNFGKFVAWQADRAAIADSFEICVLGKDPFGAVLDATVSGESIGGRKITIERPSGTEQAAGCSVLFVSLSEESQLTPILAAAQKMSLLTVSDMPHFAERGGIIGLVAQQGKIRFEVNRSAAERSHLMLSSELLKVATKVIEKPIPGS
jgi:hypothetical protein